MLVLLTRAEVSGAERKALRVSYPAPVTVYLPLWVAQEAGFFRKNGVDVELIHVGSSPIALSAFFAGDLDVLGGGGSAGPNAYLRGQRDLAFFAAMNNKFVFSIYGHPSIGSLAALRGKRVGVTRFGGTMDFATRLALRGGGLDPPRDVTVVQVGRVQDILSALIAGSIDAGTMAFPYELKAREIGYRELADLARSGMRYASSAFLGRRSFLTENKGRLEGFVRALIEALEFVRTRRSEGLKILARYTRMSGMAVLGESYDFHARVIWPKVPEIQPEDLKLVLEELASANPKAREINPADLIYGAIVSDVVASGFRERLQAR
ncbi:MAG TPA: ABC transporter substrate-binding protein [Candidatus Acidoferrales bacterium]|nr:ABC transporter substrate-binding protein [Candidatus Acidoferrales bacterium]